MAIPVQNARGLYTKAYLAKYVELIKVPEFFSSFFVTKTYPTKSIGIEVQRGTERIAIDVQRGTGGNRNKFSLSTEKEWVPPFYDEKFDVTEMSAYDRMFGENIETVGGNAIGMLADQTSMKLMAVTDKIKRAKEKMCADVFNTGVITLKDGTILDFKRRAASMVDLLAAGYWSNTDAAVEAQLIAGATFVRTKGKNGGSVYDLIMSGDAWIALKKTTFFEKNANFQNVQLMDIKMPTQSPAGASSMGRITAGAYTFNVWTYDEGYENESGVFTRFMPANKVVMIPATGTRFEMAHGGVPAIITDSSGKATGVRAIEGEYVPYDYIDMEKTTHTIGVKSAPIPVIITVDMLYTMTVLGEGNPEVG